MYNVSTSQAGKGIVGKEAARQSGKMDRAMTALKDSMARGTLIGFSLSILAFIVYTLLKILTDWWRPVITGLTGRESLVFPLTIIFTTLIIAIVGFVFSKKQARVIFAKFATRIPVIGWLFGEGRIPQSVHDMPGALVRFSEGSYYIAALVGRQKFVSKSGQLENMYKMYCPSAPVPWSGLPIIFARPEHVIILKLSFGEVYGITTSFGKSAPETLEEISLDDGLEPGRNSAPS
jgi:uncharacterized membrane protein